MQLKRSVFGAVALAALGPAGCIYVTTPGDTHAGLGRALCICDAATGKPLTEATVLVEYYTVEGPEEATPAVVLERLDRLQPDEAGCYELSRRVRWQRTWVVWTPWLHTSPLREEVAIKICAPRHQTAWFALGRPREGLDIREEPRGHVLYLKPADTPGAQEDAVRTIARHGWPPGERPVTADVVVPDDLRAQLAPMVIAAYERLLKEFPSYPHAARVQREIDHWKRLRGQ